MSVLIILEVPCALLGSSLGEDGTRREMEDKTRVRALLHPECIHLISVLKSIWSHRLFTMGDTDSRKVNEVGSMSSASCISAAMPYIKHNSAKYYHKSVFNRVGCLRFLTTVRRP